MVPRQWVMKMSSGSSRPYEQAPGWVSSSATPTPFQRSEGASLTRAHALLALLQLGEELEIPRDLGRHGCDAARGLAKCEGLFLGSRVSGDEAGDKAANTRQPAKACEQGNLWRAGAVECGMGNGCWAIRAVPGAGTLVTPQSVRMAGLTGGVGFCHAIAEAPDAPDAPEATATHSGRQGSTAWVLAESEAAVSLLCHCSKQRTASKLRQATKHLSHTKPTHQRPALRASRSHIPLPRGRILDPSYNAAIIIRPFLEMQNDGPAVGIGARQSHPGEQAQAQ